MTVTRRAAHPERRRLAQRAAGVEGRDIETSAAPRLRPRFARPAVAIAFVLLGVACGGRLGGKTKFRDERALAALIGQWRWVHLVDEGTTRRTEDERWQFLPKKGGGVIGRYVREVRVESTNGRPFTCNQRLAYTQRAVFEVEAAATKDGAFVRETGYRTEPSPCDHGFRKLGTYRLAVGDQAAVLAWNGGQSTLLRTGSAPDALVQPAWRGDRAVIGGSWTWTATWIEPRGPRRVAKESWEIGNGPGSTIIATVARTIETIDPDGARIACAGGDRWTYTEKVAVEGHREGELIRFREVGVQAAPHPCQATSPRRLLDDATVELIGDFLVLEWRGERRQVLVRPE